MRAGTFRRRPVFLFADPVLVPGLRDRSPRVARKRRRAGTMIPSESAEAASSEIPTAVLDREQKRMREQRLRPEEIYKESLVGAHKKRISSPRQILPTPVAGVGEANHVRPGSAGKASVVQLR